MAIVGGGIVGVSTARMLKNRGLTVALVEARRVGQGVSSKARWTLPRLCANERR